MERTDLSELATGQRRELRALCSSLERLTDDDRMSCMGIACLRAAADRLTEAHAAHYAGGTMEWVVATDGAMRALRDGLEDGIGEQEHRDAVIALRAKIDTLAAEACMTLGGDS